MSALTDLFTNIADAIRFKKGTSSTITASDFPSEILSLQVAGESSFKSSIAPVAWDTESDTGKQFTTTNAYGTWRIYASSREAGDDNKTKFAFDGSDSTAWKSGEISSGQSVTIGMDFPILILPTQLRVLGPTYGSGYSPYSIVVEYQNIDNTWDTVVNTTLPSDGSAIVQSIVSSNWYKGMRATLTRPSAVSYSTTRILDFETVQGLWKEMT